MIKFLKKWFKIELSYLIFGYLPAIIIVIFAVHFFSETIQ